jgi:hypothetical protein
LGVAAGLTGQAATVVGFASNGKPVNALGLPVSVTKSELTALQAEVALETQEASKDPRWTATDGSLGSQLKNDDSQGSNSQGNDNQQAQVQGQALNNGSNEVVLPISSSVALIFLAFFIGIILAYGIYKIRKITSKKDVVPGLDDSARLGQSQAQLNQSPRSSTEV